MVTVVSFKYILPQFSKNESTFTRGTKLKENLSENTHKIMDIQIASYKSSLKKLIPRQGKQKNKR